MKINIFLATTTLFILNMNVLFAQSSTCGTIISENDWELFPNIYDTRLKSGLTVQIPECEQRNFRVKHHIVRKTNGSGGISSTETEQLINNFNNVFSNVNVQFFTYSDIEYINSDTFYDFSIEENESQIIALHNIENAINIYYFNTIESNGRYPNGYTYLPSQHVNFIALAKASSSVTPIHEIGHFFGLFETHEKQFGLEFVRRSNGENCLTAGDKLCDTPADPQLNSLVVNDDCEYLWTEEDPLGDIYTPDVHNYMSYSPDECRNRFTNGQYEVMRYWANSSERKLFDQETLIQNITISQNENYYDDIILIENVNVINNSTLNIGFCNYLKIEKIFNIQLGSILNINSQ